LWLESHPNSTLRVNWKYYLDEAEQTPEVAERLRVIRAESAVKSPEDIKFIDPCMGSGHILVYAFDVLMQMYTSEGYSERDAARLILEKNLYGLDIDRRAYQLAYFALMMKARSYNRRALDGTLAPQVYEPTGYADGEEFGSLLRVDRLEDKPAEPTGQITLDDTAYAAKLNAWNFRRLLSQKYDAVVTNPPYMGSSGMGGKLAQFMKDNYPDSKSDMFAAFIERCAALAKPNGYAAMITQHAWMFLSSYEKLRAKLLSLDTVNMAHLGARAFAEIGGEVVQSTTFVLRKSHVRGFSGTYVRLVDFNDAELKETEFLSGNHRHTAASDNFAKIPGSPVAYWVGEKFFNAYDTGKLLSDVATSRVGLQTSNNDKFLRFWFECNRENELLDCESLTESVNDSRKWYPHNKGGGYRKWYGNGEYVINYQFGGMELSNTEGAATIPAEYAFREAITYSRITSAAISFRFQPVFYVFDSACVDTFVEVNSIHYLLGLLNSKHIDAYIKAIAPTINTQPGDIAKLPIIIDNHKQSEVETIVADNITISRTDWDVFETSWDFKRHPLI
jgi:hypothetical protein